MRGVGGGVVEECPGVGLDGHYGAFDAWFNLDGGIVGVVVVVWGGGEVRGEPVCPFEVLGCDVWARVGTEVAVGWTVYESKL